MPGRTRAERWFAAHAITVAREFHGNAYHSETFRQALGRGCGQATRPSGPSRPLLTNVAGDKTWAGLDPAATRAGGGPDAARQGTWT